MSIARLPKIESPLTGEHSLTSGSFWINGVTWVVALSLIFAGGQYVAGWISKIFPQAAGALSRQPFQPNITVVGRGGGTSLSTRRIWR